KKDGENCSSDKIEIQNALTRKVRDRIKANEITRFRQYLVDLREKETELLKSVEEQEKAVAREEKKVEKAFDGLNEAARELKVIEKHRENWQIEQKKDAERREQKSNDEIGAILHKRSKFE